MSEGPKRFVKAGVAIGSWATIVASVAALVESLNKAVDEIKKSSIPGVSAIQQAQTAAGHASLTDKVTYGGIGLFVILAISAILARTYRDEEGKAEWGTWFGFSALVAIAVFMLMYVIFSKTVDPLVVAGYAAACLASIGVVAVGRLRRGLWWLLGGFIILLWLL